MVLKHSHNLEDLQKQYIDALVLDISHTLKAYKQYLANDLDSNKLPKERDFMDIFSSLDSSVLNHTKTSQNIILDSIYIGGGTPNTLHQRDYERIFSAIFDNATLAKNAQITIEANPNLLNKHWCEALRYFGVNRISMGVQSFNEAKLKFLERSHSTKDISKAIELAAKIFAHCSIDVIYGTPLDSSDLLRREVETATNLPISHISAYCLMQENGAKNAIKYAKLESKIKQTQNAQNAKEIQMGDFNDLGITSRDLDFISNDGLDSSDMGEILRNELNKQGFNQYEVSSFVLEKTHNFCAKSVHNLSYWKGQEYLACGLSAVGRVGQWRYSGGRDLSRYIAYPLQKQAEYLEMEDLAFERIFLGLRSEVGIKLSTYATKQILGNLSPKSSTLSSTMLKSPLKMLSKQTFEQNILSALENLLNLNRISILINEGKCTLKGQNLVANDYFLADEIALYITKC